MAPPSYILVLSTFGRIGLVWRETGEGPKVQRLVLPSGEVPAEEAIRASFTGARSRSCLEMAELAEQVAEFLKGQDFVFPLDVLALETCSAFQQRVLRAEHGIPRGWVSTYGRIARHLEVPGASRAVGRALASNPFPILIPCHRAIRSDGELGGYQGGLEMKRALLELEGIEISPTGQVLTTRIYY